MSADEVEMVDKMNFKDPFTKKLTFRILRTKFDISHVRIILNIIRFCINVEEIIFDSFLHYYYRYYNKTDEKKAYDLVNEFKQYLLSVKILTLPIRNTFYDLNFL